MTIDELADVIFTLQESCPSQEANDFANGALAYAVLGEWKMAIEEAEEAAQADSRYGNLADLVRKCRDETDRENNPVDSPCGQSTQKSHPASDA